MATGDYTARTVTDLRHLVRDVTLSYISAVEEMHPLQLQTSESSFSSIGGRKSSGELPYVYVPRHLLHGYGFLLPAHAYPPLTETIAAAPSSLLPLIGK